MGNTITDWKSFDPEEMTLHDFVCTNCGQVFRRYVSYRELSLPSSRCRCGGELVSSFDEHTLVRINTLAGQALSPWDDLASYLNI